MPASERPRRNRRPVQPYEFQAAHHVQIRRIQGESQQQTNQRQQRNDDLPPSRQEVLKKLQQDCKNDRVSLF